MMALEAIMVEIKGSYFVDLMYSITFLASPGLISVAGND